MCSRSRVVLSVCYVFVIIQYVLGDEPMSSRQKRCIVIQKQSGTHGDSAEGAGEDYRRPQPKEPMPDRLRKPQDRNQEVEDISPEFLRFKKRFDRLRQKPSRYALPRK